MVLLAATQGDIIVNAKGAEKILSITQIDPKRLIVVSEISGEPLVLQHIESGGRALILEEGNEDEVLFYEKNRILRHINIKDIEARYGHLDLRDRLPVLFSLALVFVSGYKFNM